MNINYVANGMGAQSMYLLYLAAQKRIPATVSFTADTGWETDCDLFDGTKITAAEFFNRHLLPLATSWGIDAYFVRSLDVNKKPMPDLQDYLMAHAKKGKAASVPLFGSRDGRLVQSCTDKWKIRAMHQQARRLGATTARSAQGIHYGERARRVKGTYIGEEGGFSIYQDAVMRKGVATPVKWLTHYYPLVDLRMDREDIKGECLRLNIPFLISSECNGCPHADEWRWLRRTDETIDHTAAIETELAGEYFFTKQLRPLKDVIADWKANAANQPNLFADNANFDCTGGHCGI